MNTISTSHPLRTIQLAYHTDKTPPAWETEAMKSYFYMHDEVWRLKTVREASEVQLTAILSKMQELTVQLYPIEQEADILEVAFGIRSVDDLPDFDGSLDIDIHTFVHTVLHHEEELQKLHADVTASVEQYNAFLKDYNAFDEWFETFSSGDLYRLYQEWETIRIDTVSLDDDHQNFLDVLSPITDAENRYFDQALACFEQFKELVKTSEKIYRRTEKINEAVNKLGNK